ncbi:Trimethyllysine dioxygenase [Astrocystis sublimbata]|nr:Trimethyllysine dioxygenase [Astrocystis sublimbata]
MLNISHVTAAAAMRSVAFAGRIVAPSVCRVCPVRPRLTGYMQARAYGYQHKDKDEALNIMVSIDNDRGVVITRDRHGVERNRLPYFWLRDNCRCSKCVNQDTQQRNFNTFEIPEKVEPVKHHFDGEGLRIEWSHGSHKSFYSMEFLEGYWRSRRPQIKDERVVRNDYFAFRGHPNSSIDFSEFEKDQESAVGRLTLLIRRGGFAFVKGVPTDSAQPTEDLLRKIAFIRETHYGGFYDFIPDLAHADTAYTNLALSAHTDTTYFTDPAGLQAFHLLSHTDEGSSKKGPEAELGGKSILVDGFHAANILQEEDPNSFYILAKYGIPWHASGNKGITIAPDKLYPVIELNPETGKVHRIRWNNDDRGVVPVNIDDSSSIGAKQWYKAARAWDEILRRKRIKYSFQLEPGTVLIFDNWRVLHGRTAFTGRRRICGGYINRDDYISRWRNTNFKKAEITKQVTS